eukprot:PRCOL_00001640-RA
MAAVDDGAAAVAAAVAAADADGSAMPLLPLLLAHEPLGNATLAASGAGKALKGLIKRQRADQQQQDEAARARSLALTDAAVSLRKRWQTEFLQENGNTGSTPAGGLLAARRAGAAAAALATLRERLGHCDFRGCQQAAIVDVLCGNDAVALMATGAGKSNVYAVPALAARKLALVVSPLVALMDDQAEGWRQRGLRAAAVHSAATRAESSLALEAACAGELDVLLVTPEGLLVPGSPALRCARDVAGRGALGLVAFDEAHCCVEWGHDFRPAYARCGGVLRSSLRTALRGAGGGNAVPFLALTATATPRVVEGIKDALCMESDVAVHRSPFDRPELTLSVRYKAGSRSTAADSSLAAASAAHDAAPLVREALDGEPGGAALLYCATRAGCEAAARALTAAGVPCAYYHAGMRPADRERAQTSWSQNGGAMASTVAFGMGIDKTVRLVCHLDWPSSVERLYQEAGRAGRDGKRSRWVGYFGASDASRLLFLAAKEDRKRKRRANGKDGAADGEDGPETLRVREALAIAQKAVCRRAAILAHFGDCKLAGASEGGPTGALCCDVCGPGGKVKAQLAIDAQCAAAAEGRRRAYATPHSQFLHARAAGRKRAGMGDLIVHSDDDVYENHLSTDIDELAEEWVAESALDDGTGPTGGPPGGAPGGSGDVFDVLARYQALEGHDEKEMKRFELATAGPIT